MTGYPPAPPPTTLKGSPAHIGYEIQIIDGDSAKYPSGSVYLFAAGKTGLQKRAEWNNLDIESRNDRIRVKVNGELAAESPGDPERSKTGPIGLQLHDGVLRLHLVVGRPRRQRRYPTVFRLAGRRASSRRTPRTRA